ncbi:phosphoglycolate phosphatase [Clostridium saccharoperbutylacetonicum]|uniref:Putative phosphatase n=1 Tax=Clostridium saccharoperbutylacetonicum N1-4(HMT) TaxID=931276 RepID=M1MY23_9CLOT|nr:HAD family hydrolase [Clostridium saccharoperbutylacetonicum]AGF56297.1 putative phosphatase [Clostridium saccharoperbutylacetonicum N1-4(HMT)]NRT62959.1 phosphoglycolate phosphatase [Clostridium saccharoperbutylacetonicum]NSB26316.1 phosphoglycolate phosphatase [Clostridium saccharoperbutylacetonicum]NSB45668.1 phosphoglycolate phosphatase [Clostridium saccharoperbutylacetonicum]
MDNKFEYILFDLDGTITDSGEGITKSVQYALKDFGIEVENIKELNKFIGPPLKDSFKRFYNFDDEKAELGLRKYREYYADKGIYENSLYDGIVEVLDKLKKSNKKIILATSKPEVYAKEILKYFKIDEYFTFVGGADFEETRVSKGDVIKYALKEAQVSDLSKTIMIGDREHDIIGAKENNIKSIGVLYGYGDVIELTQARADHIIKNVDELIDIIL